MSITLFSNEKVMIIDGFINCNKCNGNGRVYNTKIITLSHPNGKLTICSECDGRGIRKPTWTEKVTLKNKLKDCIFNEL